jgi:hypothetical protein
MNSTLAHIGWVRPPGTKARRSAWARWARRILLALAACLAVALGQPRDARSGAAEDLQSLLPQEREYHIKAGFLYNFALFTEWPEAAFEATSEPLQVCILGENPFGAALDSLAGKQIKGRTIAVRQVLWADEVPRCHVLFIAASVEQRLSDIFALLDGRPVLTVGDTPTILRAGGIIGLEIVNKKIRFRVDLDNTEQAGLKLDSRLLDLAIIDRNGTAGPGSRSEAKARAVN